MQLNDQIRKERKTWVNMWILKNKKIKKKKKQTRQFKKVGS